MNRRSLSLALVLLAGCQSAPDTTMTTGGAPSTSEDADAAVGTLSALEGQVSLRADNDASDAKTGQALRDGNAVITQAASKARVTLNEGSVIAVGPDSTLVIERYAADATRRKGKLRVVAGQFWFRVTEFLGGTTEIEVETPNAVAGIRGTTVWGDVGRDLLCALAGRVELTVNGKTEELAPGECMSKMKTPSPEKLTPDAAAVGAYLQEVHIGTPLEAK